MRIDPGNWVGAQRAHEMVGKTVYGILRDTDARGLYWNKTAFKAAGLDPERAPQTWSALLSYAKKLTTVDTTGRVTRLGFDPISLQAYNPYIWMGLAGAAPNRQWFSYKNGLPTPHFSSPAGVRGLEYYRSLVDALGGIQKVSALANGVSASAPPTISNPLFSGRAAMVIDGSWEPATLKQYVPHLQYGIAPLPRPDQGGVLPNPPRWQNFSEAWNAAPFGLYLTNTMIIEVATLAGTLLSCSLAAYGFARLRFPGRDVLFVVLLTTLMLPPIVTTIPLYVEFNTLGWLNTFLPLTVPSFFGNAFYIFLLRQFLLTIPIELEDAARIDGCGWLRIWGRIIMPLAKPALAAIIIFQFLATWNDFFGPLIYLTDASKMTLAVGITTFVGDHTADWTHLMAMSALLMLPPTVLFFFTQRYFIQGIVTTGMGGR